MRNGICPKCQKPAGTLHLLGDDWLCHLCSSRYEPVGCRLFEYGVENPMDPKGSTAHVRDIKARRIDPKTKEFFYYEGPKSYFYAK